MTRSFDTENPRALSDCHRWGQPGSDCSGPRIGFVVDDIAGDNYVSCEGHFNETARADYLAAHPPRTYGEELLARAVAEYRDWNNVADADSGDDEADAAGALIATLVELIGEELGDNVHALALELDPQEV